MSQRLDIKNFGPIKNASIEIRPVLILIGQQASGKSTIAKLIYFFQSLSEEFFSRYCQSSKEYVDKPQDLIFPIREKFYDFFGSTFHLPDFEITYHYDEKKYLELSLTEKKRLNVYASEAFFSKESLNELRYYKELLLQLNSELDNTEDITKSVFLNGNQINYLRLLSDKIDMLFCNEHNDSLFIIAGRNATVGYSETFEDMLKGNIQKNIEEQGRRAFQTKEQTIDETLMFRFIQHVVKLRRFFKKFGSFEEVIRGIDEDENDKVTSSLKERLILANNLIHEILHGGYFNSDFGERIVHSEHNYVYLKNASSGQQEVIRILQDAFLSIYQGNKLLRIVEEPEAHLFPEAQRAIIHLLVLMLNSSPAGHLVLTTHSPYTLTAINNLIYASKVSKNNLDQVDKIIPKELWLPPDNIAAYILQDGEASSIVDVELGEINAEAIDDISNKINQQYDQLLRFDDE